MEQSTCTFILVENSGGAIDDHLGRRLENTARCPDCDQWFVDVVDYIAHHVQHTVGEAYQCLLCKLTFSQREWLVGHYSCYHKVTLGSAIDGGEEEVPHVDHSYYRPKKEEEEEEEVNAEYETPPSDKSTKEELVRPTDCSPSTSVDASGDIEWACGEDSAHASADSPGMDVADETSRRKHTKEGERNHTTTDAAQAAAVEEEIEGNASITQTPVGTEWSRLGHCATTSSASTSLDLTGDNLQAPDDYYDSNDSDDYGDPECEKTDVHIEMEHADNHTDNAEEFGEALNEDAEVDFRFISGLRHRRLRISCTNQTTDVGLQVFICLHCDHVSNEGGLVNHMKTCHRHLLQEEAKIVAYSSDIPPSKVFPQDVTGEEVLLLSDYHKRNLEQRAGSRKKRGSVYGKTGSKGETKRRYYENRKPCLCPECGKILCRRSALRTHMLGVHSRARNHLCEVCGKAFRSANQLSQHRKRHQKKVFACDVCDFQSDVRMAIFDHQQLHPSKFSLCHVCGTVVKSKIALTRHMRVHSASRPFPCTVEGCTWRFTSKVLRKGHIEAHSSRGEFVCLGCQRRFRKRHHVRRHLRAVHGVTSKSEVDSRIAVDAKAAPSPRRFGQIPVTQLSKEHIMITTDEHGNPIFTDHENVELVFDAKTL